MSIITAGKAATASRPENTTAVNARPNVSASDPTLSTAQRANYIRDQLVALAGLFDGTVPDAAPLIKTGVLRIGDFRLRLENLDLIVEAWDGAVWTTAITVEPDGNVTIPSIGGGGGGSDTWVTEYTVDFATIADTVPSGGTLTFAGNAWTVATSGEIDGGQLVVEGGSANTSYAGNSTGAPTHRRISIALSSLIPTFSPLDDWRFWVEYNATDGDQNSECCVLGIDQPVNLPVSGYAARRVTMQQGFGTSANRWNIGGYGVQATQLNAYTSRRIGVLEWSARCHVADYYVLDTATAGLAGDLAARSPVQIGRMQAPLSNPLSSGIFTGDAILSLGAITGNTGDNFTARFRGLRIDRRARG